MTERDWSDDIRIFHDFNGGDSLFLAEGWIVWAGSGEGGMKVRLGKPEMHPNGVVIPFEPVAGTWMDLQCEVCGKLAVGHFGMDNTPLCADHLVEAHRNYEAAARDREEMDAMVEKQRQIVRDADA